MHAAHVLDTGLCCTDTHFIVTKERLNGPAALAKKRHIKAGPETWLKKPPLRPVGSELHRKRRSPIVPREK
jgi:hypothetical protein